MSAVPAFRNRLPRWRGFNLLEMYTVGSTAPYSEEDFRWIADWGFDFVRLPLSYTHWIVDDDPFRIDQDGPGLARLDQAVEFADRHGLHVCLSLHRAPGYSVNRERREPFNLWRDAAAREAFCLHWRTLAHRYEGIANDRLSFNLVNEPPPPLPFWPGGFTRRRYEQVMRDAVNAIREISPGRTIIVDGVDYGRRPSLKLTGLRVAQSCRAYEPFELSHYRADWMPRAGHWRAPEWPLRRDHFGRRWTRERLEKVYAPWGALAGMGGGVHCGEAGCYHHTAHAVFLRWFREVLEVLTAYDIGWALWNFRGSFGVLDSRRQDMNYEDWHGHRLDRALLELLREF